MTAGYPMAEERGSLARPSLHRRNLPLTDLRHQKTLATLRFSWQWQQPGISAARSGRRNERPFTHPYFWAAFVPTGL
jgi:CHAT domain-containing protein